MHLQAHLRPIRPLGGRSDRALLLANIGSGPNTGPTSIPLAQRGANCCGAQITRTPGSAGQDEEMARPEPSPQNPYIDGPLDFHTPENV